MSVTRRFVDRRLQPRFEIVGDLWGTLEAAASFPIVDIGLGGALVVSDVPWEVGSVHTVVVTNRDQVGPVKVRVRHVTSPQPGDQKGFLVGLQFLTQSDDLAAAIDAWVARQA